MAETSREANLARGIGVPKGTHGTKAVAESSSREIDQHAPSANPTRRLRNTKIAEFFSGGLGEPSSLSNSGEVFEAGNRLRATDNKTGNRGEEDNFVRADRILGRKRELQRDSDKSENDGELISVTSSSRSTGKAKGQSISKGAGGTNTKNGRSSPSPPPKVLFGRSVLIVCNSSS